MNDAKNDLNVCDMNVQQRYINGLTLFDIGFFEPSVMGGGGK